MPFAASQAPTQAELPASVFPPKARVAVPGERACQNSRHRCDVILVAEAGGRIVGAVEGRALPGPSAANRLRLVPTVNLELAVLDEFRNRGVGRQLMAAAEEWAQGHGAWHQLDALGTNRGAVEFYRHMGYSAFGVIMAKPTAI